MTRRLADLDLCGEHTRLRPHESADAEAAFEMLAGEDEILRWLVWDGPGSREELASHYSRWCLESDDGPDLRLAIEERATGFLAGSVALRFSGHPSQGDLGYWVGLPYQGRGLGREALALCAHLSFRHLAVESLYAWVFVGNAASRRVLERTGFTLVRSVPGRIRKNGRKVDEWHFVLLASEWRRLRSDFRPVSERVDWRPADDSSASRASGG